MIIKYLFSPIHLATKQSNIHNNIEYLLGRGETSTLIHYHWYYKSLLEIDLAISIKDFKIVISLGPVESFGNLY